MVQIKILQDITPIIHQVISYYYFSISVTVGQISSGKLSHVSIVFFVAVSMYNQFI
jgi:hypothetical protein